MVERMKKHTCISSGLFVLATLAMFQLRGQEVESENAASLAANPVPFLNQPLLPDAIRPGTAGFILVINGTGFVPTSVTRWNGSPRATTFVSQSQVKASILAADITKAGAARVTVINPGPGGGTSNLVFFEITRATSSVALSTSSIRAGSNPTSAAVGDFNGDGKLDLVVANAGSKNVSVLLGNGDGTFKAPLSHATPAPQSLAVGDFNNDGKLDVAVANLATGNVSILLGNGDGTLRAPTNYVTGDSPNSIAVADFNGDGKLDLAVVNGGNNTGVSSLSILLGNGDGTFHSVAKYVVSFGNSVAVGDFNRDGKLDLAVANFGSGSVGVFLGNGDGTFKAPISFSTPGPVSVAVGDFNGDGNLDLVTANIVSNTGLNNVSVLLGKGDGTFKPAVNYGAGSNPSAVAVGDFNGDGNLDLAVANFGGYGNVSSLSMILGDGNGSFQPTVEYVGVGSNSSSLATGDFNTDGRLDMILADSGGSTVTALLQPHLVLGVSAILKPSGLAFATTQLVGTASSGLPVQLSNYGTGALAIIGISASGDFSQTHTCGSSLAAGASCTIYVVFKPTQGGTRVGELSVTDDASGSPQTISLSGTGTAVELSPTSLRFACFIHEFPAPHCVCSPPETTTLTNVGRTALDISGITISGPFSETNNCNASMPAGSSCNINVTWSRSTGSGAVSVGDDGGGSPQNVFLFGERGCSL